MQPLYGVAFFLSHKTPTKPRLSENNHIKTKNNCNKWLLVGIKVLLLVNTERIKDMKKQILSKLAKIQKVAELTGMEGKVSLEFMGCTITEWDNAIESITEFPRHNHFVEVTPKLTVALLLG